MPSSKPTEPVAQPAVVDRGDLQALLDALARRGYDILGPTVRDGAVVLDRIAAVSELPAGWTDEQAPGRYRLQKRRDDALFGFAPGPDSWKKHLHPPSKRLWRAERGEKGLRLVPNDDEPSKTAFFGVRACDLNAIAIQDRVLTEGSFTEPGYVARRAGVFVVALNCGHVGDLCFCASMGTGPRVRGGFDLCLTEVLDGPRHYFVVEVGSRAGSEVLADVPHRSAGQEEAFEAERVMGRAVAEIRKHFDTDGIKEKLYAAYEHPRWREVAKRCLACGNCTLVCPTCFCATVTDWSDLTGATAERTREWDSCFTGDFSYIHGGSVRPSIDARYRQWLMHKLATWYDQFGTSGCVGCGRCIAWCPVGIDITEEAAAVMEPPAGTKEK